MGHMHQDTGLTIILAIIGIIALGLLRLKSLLGISFEQLGIPFEQSVTLLWAGLISCVVVGGVVYIWFYTSDDWMQFLAATMAGFSTPLIGLVIWLHTSFSIRLSMVSGGLLVMAGLYLGRAALTTGLEWVVKRAMRSAR